MPRGPKSIPSVAIPHPSRPAHQQAAEFRVALRRALCLLTGFDFRVIKASSNRGQFSRRRRHSPAPRRVVTGCTELLSQAFQAE
jgi:hypothetical protein